MTSSLRCDYVEFYVADVETAAAELTSSYGFVNLLPGSDADVAGKTTRSVVLGQGAIVVVLTEPIAAGPAADFLTAHGDGLAGIGLSCPDAQAVYDRAVAHGAPVIAPLRSRSGMPVARLGAGIGDITYTVVEQPAHAATMLLPDIGEIDRAPVAGAAGLVALDHIAVCVPVGLLTHTTEHYLRGWGFDQIYEEKIRVGRQAMNSVVVASPNRHIVLTLIEPAGGEPSQIDHFIDNNGGGGVQHLAWRTDDIVGTVSRLYTAGVRFAHSPREYYTHLNQRVDTLRHDELRLRHLGVLVDTDHAGTLYQVFTQSRHERGTYFTEIIERDGAASFGANNIIALFEAKQRELDRLSHGR